MAFPAVSDITRLGVSAFTVGGGGAATVANQSAGYTETATSGTKIIFVDPSAGGFTINIPTPVGNTAILRFKNKTASTNQVVISTAANLIDGAATAVMGNPYAQFDLISDGTNWNVF